MKFFYSSRESLATRMVLIYLIFLKKMGYTNKQSNFKNMGHHISVFSSKYGGQSSGLCAVSAEVITSSRCCLTVPRHQMFWQMQHRKVKMSVQNKLTSE